jgi:hypothetical protein
MKKYSAFWSNCFNILKNIPLSGTIVLASREVAGGKKKERKKKIKKAGR